MPLPPPSARSAAEINAEMRALWRNGVLTDAGRYQRLLVEWAAAVRQDMPEAA